MLCFLGICPAAGGGSSRWRGRRRRGHGAGTKTPVESGYWGCSEGACGPQDRNGRFGMPGFSRILLVLDLGLFVIFPPLFLFLTS